MTDQPRRPLRENSEWRAAAWANGVGTFLGGLALAFVIAAATTIGRHANASVIVSIGVTGAAICYLARLFGDPIVPLIQGRKLRHNQRISLVILGFGISAMVMALAGWLARLLWLAN